MGAVVTMQRNEPVPAHECHKCRKVIRWAMRYCVGCAAEMRYNEEYYPARDHKRIRRAK